MRKLHSFNLHEGPQAALIRERLQQEGIPCLLRNEALFAAIGEIPLPECLPEIWVLDNDVWPRAKMLLRSWLAAEDHPESWACSRCGEKLEGQFGACWQCGGERGEGSAR